MAPLSRLLLVDLKHVVPCTIVYDSFLCATADVVVTTVVHVLVRLSEHSGA